MKIRLLVFVMLIFLAGFAVAQEAAAADNEAIKATALDYIEGWYSGNPERLERALHDDLSKRGIGLNPDSGKLEIGGISKKDLVELTKTGYGKLPESEWAIKVTILDVMSNSASVKIESVKYIDYVHLAKLEVKWKILNVLYESRPKKAKE